MYNLRKLSVLLLACSGIAMAEVNIQPCQKVIIAGDEQWPPYAVVVTNQINSDNSTKIELKGVGVDVAKKIFAELDVPVEDFVYSDQAQMLRGLRNNTIDLVISTMDYPGLTNDLQLLQPAYIKDHITVAVPISTTHKFISWESFVGLKGVMSTGYVLDQKTNEFINSYLHVTNKGYLLPDLQAVKYGDYQYIVGSDLQLTYAIKNNDLSQDLIVMKNLHKDINVYMAFAKGSPCKSYAIYMQKRLQDYKNNGTLEKIVQQYLY